VSPLRIAGIVVIVLLFGVSGCRRPAAAPATEQGPRNAPGFEIRYNATIALAHMGSDHIKERLDILQEMLDEQQQLRSFRQRIVDGKLLPENEAPPDPVAARTAVEAALKAIAELHRKKPDLDLSSLLPAIEKLTKSDNAVLRTEAERTRLVLTQKS
jgi:hypothetical protein